MLVEFKNKKLIELYEKGKCKKYKVTDEVVKKFIMRIRQLEASKDIYDLWEKPALNFKKLMGYKNKYSLRLEKKWHLEIEINWEDEDKTVGKIYIIELSKHYGD